MATNIPITAETPITIKISVGENVKKLKLPLKDLTAEVLPAKLKQILGLSPHKQVTFERFSDSAGGFITLDASNAAVYKTLVRAAKAKLKLRLRAVVEAEKIGAAPTQESAITPVGSDTSTNSVLTKSGVSSAGTKTSASSDKKNVGAGIFEFKQTRQKTHQDRLQKAKERRLAVEAPVPDPFDVSQPMPPLHQIEAAMRKLEAAGQKLALRQKSYVESVPSTPTWSVYCNECDAVMNNEHFHCSVCDGGDYDLCQACVDSGRLCPGEGHWLVKRFIKDGQVISSTTERLPPKPKAKLTATNGTPVPAKVPKAPLTAPFVGPTPLGFSPPSFGNGIPGAFTDDVKTLREASIAPTRTCNSCVDVMSESQFVTCKICDDFDLCKKCHSGNKHGHHPGHAFAPAVEGQSLTRAQRDLLNAGRNARHAAVCDGCDKQIAGIRHKCFECPDFDYCNDCRRAAHLTHPGHRFAALYDQIPFVSKSAVKHHGIFCDGPACSSSPHQTYITGDRYKCVVCHDTDFCSNCESLPTSAHNQTHPLLKIKTPIRGLHVSTINDIGNGSVEAGLGDRKRSLPTLDEAITASASKAVVSSASSVKTVAHIEPTTTSKPVEVSKPAELIKPIEITRIEDVNASKPTESQELAAHFVCDTIPDGICIRADTKFTQVWTLRNPGPLAWPAGCSVRLNGGDNMLNVDHERPFSASAMADATESNVIGREVQPGEEVAFKVVMKAPTRDGKAISYWRLKTADGTAFGHRLWCDITVKMPVDAPVALPVEETIQSSCTPVGAREPSNDMSPELKHYVRGYQERLEQRIHDRTAPDMELLRRRLATSHAARRAYFERKIKEMRAADQEIKASTEKAAPIVQSEAKSPAEEVKAPGLSESQMVFPTLDKESPASSTYQSLTSTRDSKAKAASAEDEETGDVITAEKASNTVSEASTEVDDFDGGIEDELFEDISSEIEVLSASSEVSDDDGFMTDEEYDILDASDQETIASFK